MIGADIALAVLMNRAADAYTTAPPPYMTYIEHTHVVGANRTEDIDRSVAVRVADDYAVMHDLPHGAVRMGPAFPVIPLFDPFSSFSFSYFANLKRVDITFSPGDPFRVIVPAPDPTVDAVVAYFSEWAPRYAPDSTSEAVHLLIDPTARSANSFYPAEVVEDPQTQLPKRVVLRLAGSDETIALDYGIVQGHWLITDGSFSSTQHVMGLSFKVDAEVTFSDFTFPATPPDPRLAGTPRPSPSPSPAKS